MPIIVSKQLIILVKNLNIKVEQNVDLLFYNRFIKCLCFDEIANSSTFVLEFKNCKLFGLKLNYCLKWTSNKGFELKLLEPDRFVIQT